MTICARKLSSAGCLLSGMLCVAAPGRGICRRRAVACSAGSCGTAVPSRGSIRPAVRRHCRAVAIDAATGLSAGFRNGCPRISAFVISRCLAIIGPAGIRAGSEKVHKTDGYFAVFVSCTRACAVEVADVASVISAGLRCVELVFARSRCSCSRTTGKT